MAAVLVQNVSKVFHLYRRPFDRILRRPATDFWALRDVSRVRGRFMNAEILGLPRAAIERVFPSIAAFAEIRRLHRAPG